MAAYYNENEKFAAAWLRELIKEKLIADGEVDERSITEVKPDDVRKFTQCHFFAGIGGWSYALRLAGWTDDRSVWTGSCPCQPFSVARTHRTNRGADDSRDLWTTRVRLIEKCQPDCIVGEQVESAVAYGWFDRLCDDLERIYYAVGACSLSAASVGTKHIRQRLYFVADSVREGRQRYQSVECVFGSEETSYPVDGHPLTRARRALAGDYRNLLPCDGLSVQVERHAIHGYGNAIVPQVAAEFIKAYMRCHDASQRTP